MLWTGFPLRLSLYFGALSFSSTMTSPSVPAAKKQPHSIRLLPAHFTFGIFFFLNSSPDVWLDENLFLSSTESYFDRRAWFLL